MGVGWVSRWLLVCFMVWCVAVLFVFVFGVGGLGFLCLCYVAVIGVSDTTFGADCRAF